MTENNKLFNALNQLQLNTNNNDLKALEKEIFTKENLKNIKANEGSDLYNFLSGKNEDGSECTIDNTINNAYQLSEIEITNFLINNKVYENDQLCSKHGFFAALLNRKAGHFCTYNKDGKIIFNSIEDGRQPIINATIGEVKEQGCGIHAIEGVLIAEALTEKGKNIEEFKQEHKKLTETSLDDLIEQRKILFKMEILDALILQNDKSHLSSFTITPEGNVLPNDNAKETPDEERERIEREALYKLYFEEFQARCAALQAVKKELEPKTQKPVRRVVVENLEEEIEQKKEEKPQIVEKQDKAVDTEKTTEEEPNPSKDTQNSEISTTSSILSEHPKMKLGTVYNWEEEKDTGIETYDIKNNKIDNINEKAAKLYLDILMQVLNETSKESGLEEMTEEKITAIRNKTEEKIDTCFTIRDENNNIIENLTKEDKEDLELARTDYKNRARVDERVVDIFNKLNELKNYHGAAKEIQKQLFQQETETVSVNV